MTNDTIDPSWPTVFELASSIPQIDLARVGRTRGGGRNRPPITQGLIPQTFPSAAGLHEVNPEQLATLIVPQIKVDGEIKGFQREKVNQHARKIARALVDGEEMPPLSVSIFPGSDKAYLVDGQHRAIGAIIARKPLEAVVKHRTIEQARKLFANQKKARTLRSDDTLLSGDSPLEIYIQDAVTSEDHPWSDLLSANRDSKTKMSPTTAAVCIGAYVFNTLSQGVPFYVSRDPNDFDTRLADDLATLIKAFGSKTTHPVAFRGRSLRAISFAAVYIFRRHPEVQRHRDIERWKKHMPTFDFGKHPHLLNKEHELSIALIDHWNKRLPEPRRVVPLTYR